MAPMTAHAIADALARGETTSRAVVEAALARIKAVDPKVNAVVTTMTESALAEADAADARRKAGAVLSRLDGVPVLVKDNICTRGTRTTCSSRILSNFVPPYDATVVERMRAAGMVILGKCNLDEFAMGSSTEHSAHGPTRNPWNLEHVPGGSSGGSAAAVAAGMAPLSLGSDTGGSIRQPAGLCGLVGLKPTYGRVSRYGLVAFASSLDQIGPFSADVEDAALLLEVLSGHDPKDSTSSAKPAEPFATDLGGLDLKGLRVGRPVEFFETEGIDPEVASALSATLDKLRAAGATIVDVRMPHAEQYSISTYYVLATAEASSNLARYDGAQYGYRTPGTNDIVEMFSRSRAEGFGAEVKRRIMLGTFVLSAETFDAYYLRAQKARTMIKRDYDEALRQVDVILAPTTPTAAFRFGEKTSDPVQMYLADIFTLSLNLAGYCGLSMPIGFTTSGLPIGMQLFAGAFEERKLLRASWQIERLLGVVGSRQPALA